eukprot:gene7288-biopygen13568
MVKLRRRRRRQGANEEYCSAAGAAQSRTCKYTTLCPVLICSVLPYAVLSCPVLSCPALSCVVLGNPLGNYYLGKGVYVKNGASVTKLGGVYDKKLGPAAGRRLGWVCLGLGRVWFPPLCADSVALGSLWFGVRWYGVLQTGVTALPTGPTGRTGLTGTNPSACT